MLDSGEAPPAAVGANSALSLAWALNESCCTAWSNEPQRAAKAPDALRAVLWLMPPGVPLESVPRGTQLRYLNAAAAWLNVVPADKTCR
jgi:hypothetical protein